MSNKSLNVEFSEELLKVYKENQANFKQEFKAITNEYRALLDKAAQLSEKFGIPCSLGESYYNPTSMKSLFGDGEDVFEEFLKYIRYYDETYFGEWWSPSTC